MFILKVVRSLSQPELNQLHNAISHHRRDTVKKLFDEIMVFHNKELDPTKAELFQAVYKRNYQKEEDYLIRKELQFLRKEIRRFLVIREFEAACAEDDELEDLFYSKSLIRHRLFDEVEKQMNKKDVCTSNSLFPIYKNEQLNSFINHILKNVKINIDSLQQIEGFLSAIKLNIATYLLYQLGNLRSTATICEYRKLVISDVNALKEYIHSQRQITDEVFLKQFFEELEQLANDAENDLSNYYKLNARLFVSQGSESIAILTGIKESLEKLEVKGFEKEAHLIITEGNLASAYLINEQYEEAIKHYVNQMGLCNKQKQPVRFTSIMNLMVAYQNTGRYEEGIELFEKYAQRLSKNPILDIMRMYLAFCHIFLNDSSSAVKAISNPPKGLAEHFKILHRMIYAIGFYIDDEIELAINEINNLNAVIYSRPVKNEETFRMSAGYLLDFFKLQLHVPGATRDSKKQKLFDNVRLIMKESGSIEINPHMLWLLQQLKS